MGCTHRLCMTPLRDWGDALKGHHMVIPGGGRGERHDVPLRKP
jgi:hypothetical protein